MSAHARRSFLGKLAAAVAMPSTAVLPAIPAAAAIVPPDEAELLALGARLDALVEAYEAAAAREVEAVEAFDRLKPAIPPELVASPAESRDLTEGVPRKGGGWMMREDRLADLRIYRAEYLRRWIKEHPEISRHTKAGKLARRLERIAKKYEADTAEAMRATDLEARRWAASDFTIAMQDIVEEILAVEPKTAAGIGVYARAVLAGARILHYDSPPSYNERLGSGLAGALVRIGDVR